MMAFDASLLHAGGRYYSKELVLRHHLMRYHPASLVVGATPASPLLHGYAEDAVPASLLPRELHISCAHWWVFYIHLYPQTDLQQEVLPTMTKEAASRLPE
jgi:hypothetical protein